MWVCLTVMMGMSFVFMIAVCFELHPTEIRVYANDELVNLTKYAFEIQRDLRFNECIDGCVPSENMTDNCYSYCADYYEGFD